MDNKQPPISRCHKIIILIAFGVLVMLFGLIVVPEIKSGRFPLRSLIDDLKSTEQAEQAVKSYEPDEISAWVMTQQFVKSHLKCPSTAKFPWAGATAIKYEGEGMYKVTSYVDSQNSFGAMIRTPFFCIVSEVNGEWVLDWLDM